MTTTDHDHDHDHDVPLFTLCGFGFYTEHDDTLDVYGDPDPDPDRYHDDPDGDDGPF